jgi:hypothetical protein
MKLHVCNKKMVRGGNVCVCPQTSSPGTIPLSWSVPCATNAFSPGFRMPGQGQALSLLETVLLFCCEHSSPRFLGEPSNAPGVFPMRFVALVALVSVVSLCDLVHQNGRFSRDTYYCGACGKCVGENQSRYCHASLSSAKHLAAQREILRCAQDDKASLRMTSDPRLLPLLVGNNHYRPLACRCAPQADTSAVRQ